MKNDSKEPWPTLCEPYYVPDIIEDNLYRLYHWAGDKIDKRYKELNLVFKTKEEAIEVTKKILKALNYKKDVDNEKI